MFGWAIPSTSPMLQARLDIESDIDVHIRAISDLRTRLNTLTPIGSLPPELLSEILVHCAVDDYRGASNIYPDRLSWTKLSHVSRHFRAVALSTPEFWSYLRLRRSQVFAELLARSMGAPLHVTAHPNTRSRWDADRTLALNMLLPHSRRIRELNLEGSYRFIQSFCSKTIFFDILEKLRLTVQSRRVSHLSDSELRPALSAFVPVLTSSTAPPRLRHLELRGLPPFCWDDVIFSSPTLTTLVVTANDSGTDQYGSPSPKVTSFNALCSALAAVAPSLEVLELGQTIPQQSLTVASPLQLPLSSQTIRLSSIKHIRLDGDARCIARLLNRISSPSTAALQVLACSWLGDKELMQSIATHMSERTPFSSIHLHSHGHTELTPYILSGWTSFDTTVDALLKVGFHPLYSRDDAFSRVLQYSGSLCERAQELRLSGTPMSAKWADVFTRFPRMRKLVLDAQPSNWADMLSALMTARRLEDGEVSVLAPSLRVIHLSYFNHSRTSDDLQSSYGLLDLAIFRCNCGVPIDKICLDECQYLTTKEVERLKEVVVDVQWYGQTMPEDSDGDFGKYLDSTTATTRNAGTTTTTSDPR